MSDRPKHSAAAIDRPLALRQRPDLVVVEQWFRGRRWYVVQDPLTVAHFYFTEQEHSILTMLDGRASVAEIQSQFARRFAPQRLEAARLTSFVSQLHKSGLVLGEASGQGEQLTLRRTAKESGPLRWLERLFAMRFRGVDPRPLLDWLDPRFGWIFGPVGVTIWLIVVLAAILLTVARAGELHQRWPDVQAFITSANVVWLGVAMMLVKTLHELGHAMVVRRYGCRCREMGFQLFFLMPCLYTNVSEVWLVPSKWRRIAVSAAGMYVELFLAAVATIVWWLAEPGPLASICWSVMLVASLGTLVLNGNPLMRYDGYYILADLIEAPNLEQRSRLQLSAWLARWGLGIDWQPGDQLDERQKPWLAAYAAAALAYRAGVIVGLYFAVRAWLRPWRLEAASDVLVAVSVVGLVAPLAGSLGHFLMQQHRRSEIRSWRLALSAAVLSAIVAAVCLVPLPQRVVAPAVIQPRLPNAVYVTVDGTLVENVPPGTILKRGEQIARLESLELRRDLVRLQAQLREQEVHLIQLDTTRGADPAAAAAIPAAQEALADLKARILQLEELIGKLTLVAPADGVVLPPPQSLPQASETHLASWTGTPLDRDNSGCFLETGTLVCQLAKPGDVEATAIVDQASVTLVQPGSRARLVVPGAGGGAISGVVEEVARLDGEQLPLHLVAAGVIPQRTSPSGKVAPSQTIYEVRIKLDNPPASLVPGNVIWASIAAPAEPLGSRLSRWLGQTFRFGVGGD